MNKVLLIGRLTRDPEVRYSGENNDKVVAKYTLAVERRFKKEGDDTADFIGVTAFGKGAEFSEKYLHKGMKIAVIGRIQTGTYTNKDGQKVYTTDVVAEDQEFAESKNAAGAGGQSEVSSSNNSVQDDGDFMNISDGVKDDMPF